MTTKKLYIKYISDEKFIEQKQMNYSYAFRRLYKMFEESSDKDFMHKFKETFSLNDIEYRSLVSDVKSFKKREETEWEEKTETVNDLIKQLQTNDKLSKRQKFKIANKISYLSRGIEKESTFGGRALQQELTREHNKKNKDEQKIQRLTKEFRSKRVLSFSVMGEANQNGNRFFDLSMLSSGVVTYKPFKGKKITIEINIPKGWSNDIKKLSELTKDSSISVSIRLSNKYIYLSYDEERLNGYAIDEVSRRKDVKDVKSKRYPKEIECELIKEKYKEYYDIQRESKLIGKVRNRCIAIDMNPINIGYSILDKFNDYEVNLISCGHIDLSNLCGKSGRSSSSQLSKYLNNKRRYEITIIVKELFKVATHYGCSSFIVEKLNLKENGLSRESNRKVKNVWNRELFMSCVTRRCNECGIELIEVNPCYSSFIGNIQHPYVDATNASIEIGRRGLFKYDNGGFYPHIKREDIRTLEAKFGDVVECSTTCDWVNIYKSLKSSFNDSKEFSYRLRTRIDEVEKPMKSFSMNSYKSNVKITIFN